MGLNRAILSVLDEYEVVAGVAQGLPNQEYMQTADASKVTAAGKRCCHCSSFKGQFEIFNTG
jgi:hypothetical protein